MTTNYCGHFYLLLTDEKMTIEHNLYSKYKHNRKKVLRYCSGQVILEKLFS